jgi:putative nucleotidyltransferase with HDIG domain
MIATNQLDRELVEKARDLGIVGYLAYPFEPDALLKRVSAALGQHQEMSKEQIQRNMVVALKKILVLPTISPVTNKLQELIQAQETSVGAVAEVIEFDQSITAKVLQASNSPMFGQQKHIASVADAVKVLGFERLESLVLAASTFEAIGRIKESPDFPRLAFWQHSIGCGAVARVAASKLSMNSNQAFSAGILHDVGKVILDGYFSNFFNEALKTASTQNISIIEAEKEVSPITHEGVGRYLAILWRLPQSLVEVVGNHHSLVFKKEEHRSMVQLIHVANAYCRKHQIGFSGDHTEYEPAAEVLEQLGLEEGSLEDWSVQIQTEIDRSFSLLSLI